MYEAFESLLLPADLLTFLSLTMPQLHAWRWTRNLAVIAVLVMGVPLLLEGPRWQMVLAYALSVVFFLGWLRQISAPVGMPAAQTWAKRLAPYTIIMLGVVGLLVSIVLPILVPIFHFLHPANTTYA